MATLRFGEQDRDEDGFIRVPAAEEPRSLATLLPPVAAAAPAERVKRPTVNRQELIGGVLAAVVVVVMLLYFGGDRPAPAAPQSRATAAPAAPRNGDRIAEPSPIPATTPAVTGRLLVAFAEPDGAVLGPIEATRAITPTAHYGQAWIQADVAGSGLVWLRAGDAPELAIVGPDLRPRPTALVATQPPAPAPTVCAEVGVPGKMTSSCGYDDLSVLQAQAQARWIEQYGGNVGQVGAPTPQVREP